MLIHLSQVRREPVSWDETVAVEPSVLERDEVVALSPVTFSGRVSAARLGDEFGDDGFEPGSGFYFAARYAYTQTLACQRCLEPVEQPVEGDLSLLLVQDAPQLMAGERQLDEEDLGLLHVDGDEVDTRPLLLEQMQLNVPMKPVCREDCRGLCKQCGADLNDGDCGCEDDWVDPRWAALKDFKPKGADGEPR